MKKVISIIAVLGVLLLGVNTVCFANVKVTDNNLKQVLEEYVNLEANTSNYKVETSRNNVKIDLDDVSFDIKYQLNDVCTFKLEIPIEKGMTYDEYEIIEDNIFEPFKIIYAAIAQIQGISVLDAEGYFQLAILSSLISNTPIEGTFDFSDGYMIVGDNVTVHSDSIKVIKKSEFGDRVVEYANYSFQNASYSDKTGINSFLLNL